MLTPLLWPWVSVGRTVGPIQACPNSPEPGSEMGLEVTGVSERFRVEGLGFELKSSVQHIIIGIAPIRLSVVMGVRLLS